MLGEIGKISKTKEKGGEMELRWIGLIAYLAFGIALSYYLNRKSIFYEDYEILFFNVFLWPFTLALLVLIFSVLPALATLIQTVKSWIYKKENH